MPAPALQAAGAVVAGRDLLPRLLAALGAASVGLLLILYRAAVESEVRQRRPAVERPDATVDRKRAVSPRDPDTAGGRGEGFR